MNDFIKRYWLYWVIGVLILGAGTLWLTLMTKSAPEGGFVYQIN